MSTFLFDSIIFGPIQSRRLGVSLGVNLIRPGTKFCNFDCIYCECGWNSGGAAGRGLNTIGEVSMALERWFLQNPGTTVDYITFSGNGEPTLHPDFAEIIDNVLEIRSRVMPRAKVAVLSNSTMLGRGDVTEALLHVDRPILKFDSAINTTYTHLNQPQMPRSVEQIIGLLEAIRGRFVMQTMFLRDTAAGVDNTTEVEISAWIEAIKRTEPTEVMIYSLDRDTPQSGLVKVGTEELAGIAQRVERETGIRTTYPGMQ